MRVNPAANNPVQSSELSSTKQTARSGKTQKPGEKSSATESTATAADGSSATISARAKEFSKAKEVAGNAPDVREEKIAELKRRISAGKYSVDADAVADRMVDDHLKTGIG